MYIFKQEEKVETQRLLLEVCEQARCLCQVQSRRKPKTIRRLGDQAFQSWFTGWTRKVLRDRTTLDLPVCARQIGLDQARPFYTWVSGYNCRSWSISGRSGFICPSLQIGVCVGTSRCTLCSCVRTCCSWTVWNLSPVMQTRQKMHQSGVWRLCMWGWEAVLSTLGFRVHFFFHHRYLYWAADLPILSWVFIMMSQFGLGWKTFVAVF